MPLAVTHVILTLVTLSLYRHYIAKRTLHRGFVIVGGIAGLLPDLDFPVDWAISKVLHAPVHYHRVFTHALIWPLLFVLIGFVLYVMRREMITLLRWKVASRTVATFFFVLAFGWFFHLFLDCSLQGDDGISFIPIIAPATFCLSILKGQEPIMLDAIVLVAWLIHEEYRHNIKEYI